jgi:O-acetylhomoserine/O-acetylserine sulfhydrylase-like pyridoxal-dependent enzyme
LHSATKFLGGHGVAIGGLLVDSGAFDWDGSGKFPTLSEPYEGFHGMDFSEESTRLPPSCMRARREGLRDFGACMSPLTAFQLLQGVETLPLRMERHIANTRRAVAHLVKATKQSPSVGYPELEIPSRPRPGTKTPAAWCRLGVQFQRSRAVARPGANSSRPCACSPIWPTSATPNRW